MRPMTFAEKVLARAAGRRETQAGEMLEVRPNWVLSHDNTAAIARIFHEQLGAQRVCCPERLCIFLDHAAPPPTPRHARNHAEVRAFVRAQGVEHFYEVGRGVCHQVIAEEGLVLPGQVILGADSHTTHHGWLGAFGAGVGRTEVAALWLTGSIWLRVPKSVRITLEGKLPPNVTAKDLALTIIGELGADGGRYRSVEFAGPGMSALPLADRMTLANMMAEFGVKNVYLPPDEAVFAALEARCPDVDVRAGALYPDPGARYIAHYRLHLDRLQPVVACPHTVDRVHPLAEATGRPVTLAFIGTCTNGRLEDLAAAARVLQDKQVHPSTRLIVVPASQQVLQQAMAQGVLQTLVAAGAVIGTPGVARAWATTWVSRRPAKWSFPPPTATFADVWGNPKRKSTWPHQRWWPPARWPGASPRLNQGEAGHRHQARRGEKSGRRSYDRSPGQSLKKRERLPHPPSHALHQTEERLPSTALQATGAPGATATT